MTNWTELAERYLDVWNEEDEGKRRELAAGLFTPDCRFTDPAVDVRGPEAIEAVIGQVRTQFAGHELRLAGAADGHHDQGRFTWELGEGPLVVGFDVVVTAGDGKIQQVLGFLDKVPA